MADAHTMDWQSALETAARRLAAAPEHCRQLQVFVDYWGLDSYSPPPEVDETVRNAIAGLLACARAIQKQETGHG